MHEPKALKKKRDRLLESSRVSSLSFQPLSAPWTIVANMSTPASRTAKASSTSPFNAHLEDLAAQAAEEENVIPTSQEILRRGFDWKNIAAAYGGDLLQQDFEVIRQFDHKNMDAVGKTQKVRIDLFLRLLSTASLYAATNPQYSLLPTSSILDMPSPSLPSSPRSKVAKFVNTCLPSWIDFFKVRSTCIPYLQTLCIGCGYVLDP